MDITSAIARWHSFDLTPMKGVKRVSPNTRVMFDSLTPGKTYWARVRTNGTAGPSDWSNPATAMAV